MKNYSPRLHRRLSAGFTLIELMITLTIVAILSAIALPAYDDYVIRGRIPQATNNLSGMRVKMEQYFQDNRSYLGACAAGTSAPLPASDDFVYSCPTLAADTYTIQATGRNKMTGFTYTLDHTNAKQTTATKTGWGTPPLNCWVIRKGGVC